MKKLYKGLLLAGGISVLSHLLHIYALPFLETLTIGILLGMLYANTIGMKKAYEPGVTFALKKVLKWGIVLLGVKLNFSLLIHLGPKILLIIVALITLALVSSYYLGKSHKLNAKLSVLLGVGSSICGASAIVAMGPVIDADDEDIAISVTVISLLGAVGVLVYSALSKTLALSDIQYGVWAGSSLQGVAHALAAAGARGADSASMEIGTLVKMARVAMLAPVAMILGYAFSTQSGGKKVKFPMYVLYFILVGLLFSANSYFEIFPVEFTLFSKTLNIVSLLKSLSGYFILISMVAMGLKVNLKSFEKEAFRSLIACTTVFVILSLCSISLIFISAI